MDGASLYQMMTDEQVSLSLGVPTVWLGLLQYMAETGQTLPHMRRTMVGGSALSEFILREFEEKHDVEVVQGWGMTEMTPIGTINGRTPGFEDLSNPNVVAQRLKQGKAMPGVEMRIVDAAGHILPWDGEAVGHLQVRGPWIIESYYKAEEPTLTADGWFDTGDVAKIYPDGCMQITDRSKDVIKSGGEWISSIDIENAAMNHPEVAQAAVIAAPHPKWQERPLLVVVLTKGAVASADDVRGFVADRLPRIAHPDAVEIVDEMPLGATGKVLKTELRDRFKGYAFAP